MTMREKLELLEKRRAEAEAGGGPKRLEAQHVRRARRSGWTWEQIGDSLGVSRQAVHKKYRKEL